jgi:hypothetical protein
MSRRPIVFVTVTALVGLAGCASSARSTARTVEVQTPAAPAGPLLLAQFATGVGAVAVGAPTPVWHESTAVAALDGTAVFVVQHAPHGDALARLDLRTGAVAASWPLAATGLTVEAVSPGGRWVALTDRAPGYGRQSRASTRLVVFDTTAGDASYTSTLTGDVQPEAFSVDGTLVFALNYHTDYYRVQTITLATGERYDTARRDKGQPVEDMHGHAVHGVMSADRTLLATLYRNPGDTDEPAFVHVIDLTHGWSYCADLPAPFGTGPAGSDVIQLTAHDTVLVAANAAGRLAEVRIDDVRTPGPTPVRVTYRPGTIAPAHPELESIPGFSYVLAPLPE